MPWYSASTAQWAGPDSELEASSAVTSDPPSPSCSLAVGEQVAPASSCGRKSYLQGFLPHRASSTTPRPKDQLGSIPFSREHVPGLWVLFPQILPPAML